MAGINVEHGMWKQLMEVMDRLDKVEREAREQHRRDSAWIKELEARAVTALMSFALCSPLLKPAGVTLSICGLLFVHSSLISPSSPDLWTDTDLNLKINHPAGFRPGRTKNPLAGWLIFRLRVTIQFQR